MSLSRKQVEELLNYFDTDNDGLISYQEFEDVIRERIEHVRAHASPRLDMPKSPAGEVRVFSCGDRIKAKCPGWIKYYQGKIVAVDKGRGVYDILFDDGIVRLTFQLQIF